MRSWLLLFSLLGAIGMVSAETPEMPLDRVTLQASAATEVANDRMRAVLAVEQEDSDPARLADAVNRTMAWALERARKAEGITVASGGYRTQPVYQKSGGIGHWRAVQTLQLESGDFVRLSELLGRMQERLALKSLDFTVSDASRRAAEEQLIDEALDLFKARATQVQTSFAAGGWRLVDLHIDSGGMQPPMPLYRAMEMADAPAPVVAEGGTSRVQVQVNGTVQLLPGSVIPRTK